jgi:hypothetical protein
VYKINQDNKSYGRTSTASISSKHLAARLSDYLKNYNHCSADDILFGFWKNVKNFAEKNNSNSFRTNNLDMMIWL